jgi:hypothetical protein
MRSRRFRGLIFLLAAVALALPTAPDAAAQTTGWQPGPDATPDSVNQGFIDSPGSGAIVLTSGPFLVRGWFVDPTAQGWAGTDNVQIWLGPMDGGGQLLSQAQVGQSRPDVAAALNNPAWTKSGFSASVPGAAVPGGPQTLYVYAHTPGKGWWYQTVNVNGGGSGANVAAPSAAGAAPGGPPQLQVVSPTEGEDISQLTREFTVTGQVNDAANTTIDVWFDGERTGSGGTDLGTATPLSDGSWSLVINPTHFPTGHHNLYVYANDSATGLQSEAVQGFNITNH